MKRSFVIILALLIFLSIWFYYPLRCCLIMPAYSAIHESKSVMHENNFKIHMPSGLATVKKDWFIHPFIYNTHSFRSSHYANVKMSIIYTFPAFHPLTRKNMIFDETSPYYSAFYGAYVLNLPDGSPYGFIDENNPSLDQILDVFRYDYTRLVLRDLGCKDLLWEQSDYSIKTQDYIGYEDWVCIEADITTRGLSHTYSGFLRNYIQYGRPSTPASEDYPLINFKGKMMMRFFPELKSTIILYAGATDEVVVRQCFDEILSNCRIQQIH